MNQYQKPTTELKSEVLSDDYFIEGIGSKRRLVDELSEKLKEAKSIASEIASTQITIEDKRLKDIKDYTAEIRKEFKSTFHYEPSEYFLVAKCGTRECRLHLNL